MKCLSLWQPWASLIGRGKSIETRSWKTDYRGPIAIHAGLRWTEEEANTCAHVPFSICLKEFPIMQYKGFSTYRLPLGVIVAVANLADCIASNNFFAFPDARVRKNTRVREGNNIYLPPAEFAFGNFNSGRFGWLLEDIRILPEPIFYRGRQRLFTLDNETALQLAQE